jgi:hypothetical protein
LTGNQSIYSWNAKSSRELFPIRNGSMTVVARKDNGPRFAAAKVFRSHLRTAFPRMSRVPRGFTVEEGPLAATSPQTPWLGGADSALRLVTCRSSDALPLSSSARTSRKSPLKAAVRYASSSSSCALVRPLGMFFPQPSQQSTASVYYPIAKRGTNSIYSICLRGRVRSMDAYVLVRHKA